MEEKKFREIKAGTRVTVNGREYVWGVGTVVMQSEMSGKCLIRFGKAAEGLHNSGGLFRENCAVWCDADELAITGQPGETEMDPKKNWVVLLQSVDGEISHYWRAESRRFAHGWLKEKNIDPITAMEKWIEGNKASPAFTQLFGLKTAKPAIDVNVDASELIGGLEAVLETIREINKNRK